MSAPDTTDGGVVEAIRDEIDDLLRPLHWEAWKAGVFTSQDEWPDDDEQNDLCRGIDGVAVGEHWDAWGREIVNKIVSRITIRATPTPAREAEVRWTPMSCPPIRGGHYAVGGYVTTGGLPRRFERAYATCILTLDGPSWSHCDDRRAHIPLQYWFELPSHPELAAIRSLTPPVADGSGDVEVALEAGDVVLAGEGDGTYDEACEAIRLLATALRERAKIAGES